jgi:phosphonopyruvate decarboxylase
VIQAEDFVEAAKRFGFTWYAGVPCSFLTPFINYVINDQSLVYLSAVNEGDALAAACGASIGGQRAIVMMQNSGLGNAINPLTSLTYSFRIPLLLIITLRGDPQLQDEPQHELMGQITGQLLSTLQIPWEFFPTKAEDIGPVLQRVEHALQQDRLPYALIMRKGSVAPHTLKRNPIGDRPAFNAHSQSCFRAAQRASRTEALQQIVKWTDTPDTVVIATTGYTGRELFALCDRPNHLYMVGSMGCASSLGLGLCLSRPDLKVVVIDGDGAALMRMGNFAMIGAYGGPQLTHILLDNEAHDSTGSQATVSSRVAFAQVATACGYEVALAGDDLTLVDDLFARSSSWGAKLAHLKIRTGTIDALPRPKMTPAAVLQRLMQQIGSMPSIS